MSDDLGKQRLGKRTAQGAAGPPPVRVGTTAANGQTQLHSFQVGALPLLNQFLDRLQLGAILRQHLPTDDVRQEIPSERILLLLVRNVLVSREPLYGVPEWAARYSPDLFGLYHCEMPLLHDDRLGSCLPRLFTATTPALILAVVRSAIREFGVSLDELHNDSTTVSFHGDYPAAEQATMFAGREQPAITWGHSKDHRPDLKQLLFTLTLANDGGVPVYFSVASGNTTDDTTHCQTWDLLRELVGGPDFLYVADCKLASRDNLRHIAARGGRFITVLPATRREDADFRRRVRETPATITWETCWIRVAEHEEPPRGQPAESLQATDVIQVCTQDEISSDGFRVLWYHSQRKAELDEAARAQRCQRAIQDLEELQRRLFLPRTRFRNRLQVEQAVQQILAPRQVESLLRVEITERQQETFHQEGRGRPTQKTKYRREVASRYELRWQVDEKCWRAARADDGIFPLLTNERTATPREVLEAYKRQPKIEKRFSQLKSDFGVAPVFLKSPPRVLGLFTVYFLALLVQALLERELRRALQQAAVAATGRDKRTAGSIGLYPEGRRSRRPTARRILDLLEPIRRHEISQAGDEPLMLIDDLTPTQQQLTKLLGMNPQDYGK